MARKKKTTVGGNLWQIAAQTLGDATQANRLATANNTTDPFISGSASLFLPAVDLTATGGLPFGPIVEPGVPFTVTVPVAPSAPVPPPPPIVPPVVNNPPVTAGPWFFNVRQMWEPAAPLPTLSPRLPPMLAAVRVDSPPASVRARGATTQRLIARAWEPPDPLPTLRVKSPPSLAAVPVNPPPASVRARGATTQGLISASWIPPDPLPTLSGKVSPSISAVAVNNPTPNDGPWLPNILASWLPPDPLPTPQRKLQPQLTIPRVDAPVPGGNADWLAGINAMWVPASYQPPAPMVIAAQITPIETASGTEITTVGPKIIDANSAAWDMVASTGGNQVRLNGAIVTVASTSTPPFARRFEPFVIPSDIWPHDNQWILLPSPSGPTPLQVSASATEIAYFSRVVYYEDTTGQWFSWTGSAFVHSPDPRIVVPGAPTGLTSTAVSANSINLSWVKPSSGSTPSTYNTQYSLAGAGVWLNGPTVSVTSAQIVGLASGTSYDFRVSATNSQGTGAFSATYTTSTAAASGPVTWQATGKSATISLSANLAVATSTGSAAPFSTPQSVVSTTSLASGKAWFQVTIGAATQNVAIGLANSSFTMGALVGLGGDVNGVGYFPFTGVGSQAAQTAYFQNGIILPRAPTQTLASAAGQITDTQGAIWTLVSTANGLGIVRNGVLTVSANVVLLLYWNNLIWQNAVGHWWYWSNVQNGWIQASDTDPRNVAADIAGMTATFLVDRTAGLWWAQTPAMVAQYGINAWNDDPTSDPFNGIGGLPIGVAGSLSICFFTYEAGAIATLNAGGTAVVGAVNIPSNFPAWTGQIVQQIAPGAVVLTPGMATATTAPLSWTTPSGTPQISYTVQRASAGTITFVPVATGITTTFYTDTGLTQNGVTYQYQVFAANSAGTGPTSNIISITTSAQTVVPLQVGPVTLVSAIVNSIMLNVPLNTSGSPATSYQMQYRPVGPGPFSNGPLYNESADGTDINTSGIPVMDAAGIAYVLVTSAASGLQVTVGGVLTASSNATDLIYWNHSAYYKNQAGVFFKRSGAAWIAVAADPRLVAGGNISPSGTALTSNIGSILDASNKVWALTGTNGQITVNGVIDTDTAGVVLLVYWNGFIYQLNNLGTWYENDGVGVGHTHYSVFPTDPRFVTLTIGGLVLNQAYNVQVFAANSAGSGPPSALLTATVSGGVESPDKTNVTTAGVVINASPTPGAAGSGNLIAITAGGTIAVGGTVIGGANVVRLYYTNHTAYQFNGTNWFGPITATATGTQVSDPTVVGTSGTFSTNASGQIIDPHGNVWVGRGAAIDSARFGGDSLLSYVTNAAGQPLTTLLPGIKVLRIACYEYFPPTQYLQITNWLTALGIVVIYEDHQDSTGTGNGGGAGVVFSGATLAQELAWYQALATQFNGNPYVWFGTTNEPSINPSVQALWNWQQSIYNTIRAVNPTCMIELEVGGVPSQWLGNPFVGGWTNIIFGPHFYGWVFNAQFGGISQADIFSSAPGAVTSWGGITQICQSLNAMHNAQGHPIPAMCLEFGPGTVAPQDVSGNAVVDANFQAANAGVMVGWAAWNITPGGGVNQITNSPSQLQSPYGVQVASQILNQTGGL